MDPKPTMRLRLHDVVVYLKKQGYPLENTFVSFYSAVFSAFINCNVDPVSKKLWLTEDDLELFDDVLSLRLKFQRSVNKQYNIDVDSDENEDLEQSVDSLGKSCKGRRASSRMNDNLAAKGSENTSEHKLPRTKERTVGYIIDKVSQWRRLYNGTYDQNFNHQRMSLEDAAVEVGV
jgi:hypothetical protein